MAISSTHGHLPLNFGYSEDGPLSPRPGAEAVSWGASAAESGGAWCAVGRSQQERPRATAAGPYSLAPYPGILLNHLAEYNVLYVRVLYMYIHQCSSSQQYMYNTRT
jgi:hypothetical protein